MLYSLFVSAEHRESLLICQWCSMPDLLIPGS